MARRPIITLTTDFGYDDPFVGVMKGVILKINPDVEIVDFSHGIKSRNIAEAAFTIGMNYRYFPDGTVHVVVVDPGVGSMRRPILVRSGHNYFIGPDNGVFTKVYAENREILEVIHITASHYFLSADSPTFHGRDVFAPVAAWFLKGVNMYRFGDAIHDFKHISLPVALKAPDGGLCGEVIKIDKYGNAITSISVADIRGLGDAVFARIDSKKVPLFRFYSEAREGVLGALVNSSDLLEFFVYMGSAARDFEISVGDFVEVKAQV